MNRFGTVTFFEHEKKTNVVGSERLFTTKELDQLEKINSIHKCEIFKLGRNSVQATQYVGFVKCGRKSIQVVPKISKGPTESNLHFLFYLLKYTKRLIIKDLSVSMLQKFEDDFFEVMIWLFAKNLNQLLQHDLKKTYVFMEEQTEFLKGKLLIAQQVKQCTANRTKLFCRYNEFTENNLLNQILKFVSYQLFLKTCSSYNQKLLQNNLMLLDQVAFTHVCSSDVQKLHFDRLNREYKPLIDLCALFLSGTTTTFKAADFETFAFMFDMNKLFEEFVFEFMLRHTEQLEIKQVTGQKSLGKLFDEFSMYYDILLQKTSGEELLIDTKYKILDKEKCHAGVSQLDLYQMFSYSQSQIKKYPNIVLLYPKTEVGDHDFEHTTEDGAIRLAIRSLDLEEIWDSEECCFNESAMLNSLKSCLN